MTQEKEAAADEGQAKAAATEDGCGQLRVESFAFGVLELRSCCPDGANLMPSDSCRDRHGRTEQKLMPTWSAQKPIPKLLKGRIGLAEITFSTSPWIFRSLSVPLPPAASRSRELRKRRRMLKKRPPKQRPARTRTQGLWCMV